MKILLVLPAAESVRVTRERPVVTKRAMLRFSVLPLTAVAALTPAEHELRIVDENVEALDVEVDVDVVGVTFMTALAPRAYEIAREFRARGKTVVAGGYHATLCTEEVLLHFDAVVVGDAEGAWPQLLQDIEAGQIQKVYRSARPEAELHTPVPRRDLLESNAKHYVTLHAVQTGRGCPHGCRYCSITTFHQRKHRQRPLAEMLAELREVPRNFMFVDDNIISDRQYARELFHAMAPCANAGWASARLRSRTTRSCCDWRRRRAVADCSSGSNRRMRTIWRRWARRSTTAPIIASGSPESAARESVSSPGLSWAWTKTMSAYSSGRCGFWGGRGSIRCN